ncbi:MAG TPA: hypothetical protein VMV86_06665 [Methanosarcinales archaeon]|nr:hypothetical protein [Methanosarcinales archaeon]
MKVWKIIGIFLLFFAVLAVIMFATGGLELAYMKFFGVKKENVRREIFEQTQSYNHGKIQDLAKYYEEYQKAEGSADKEAIRSVILMRFAEFDANKINPPTLRSFLTSIRGY